MDLEETRARIQAKASHPTVTVGLLLFLTLNTAMMVIGFIKKEECPADPRIPHYLIVAGAIGIASKLLPFVNRKLEWTLITFIVLLLYLFEFALTIIVGSTIGLFIYLCLNISMMIWGIKTKDECPADPRIPLYLIAEGAAGITSELLSLINRKLKWRVINLLLFILYLFQLIWSILGSVWVYQIYKPDFNPRPDNNYCSAVAYLSVFCLLTIYWICVALFILISFCSRFILVAKQK